jgi:hypothetical protein
MDPQKVRQAVNTWTEWESELSGMINSILTEKQLLENLLDEPPATPRVQMIETRAEESHRLTGELSVHPLHLLMGSILEKNSQVMMALEGIGHTYKDLIIQAERGYSHRSMKNPWRSRNMMRLQAHGPTGRWTGRHGRN